jgi:hypothetical protein
MKTHDFSFSKYYKQLFSFISFLILCTYSSLVLAQVIVIEPDTLNLNISNTFTVKNTGDSRLDYIIESNTSFRTFHSNGLTELNSLPVSPGPDGLAAIPNDAKWAYEVPTGDYSNYYNTYWLSLYSGFEGWASTGENWKYIKNGDLRFFYRGLSDGSGVASGFFSPRVEVGSENVSSFSMEVNFIYSKGTTWQIVPQSLTNNQVVTRFQVNPDQTIQVLVKDNFGHASYQRINVILPTGYFHLSMEVDRKTSLFTIFFNGQRVFTGKGFSNSLEQVAALSLNESEEASMQINMVNWDVYYPFYLIGCNPLVLIASDNENNYSDLSKVTGSLEPGASVTRSVGFSESDLIPGTYRDSLKVSTNDPDNPIVFLPYSITVDRPYIAPADYSAPPASLELEYNSTDVTLYKGDTVEVYFTLKNKSEIPQSLYFPQGTEIPLYKAFSHGSQNFDWKDISTTGTRLFLGNDDSQTVMMPDSGSITIGSNGYLSLGSTPANDPANRQIWDTYDLLSNIIAPYWDDLAPDDQSAILYLSEGDEFIVQYTNIPFNGTNIRNTFQVILYADGAIKYQYLHMHDRQSATIAVAPGYNPDELWGQYSRMDIANNEPFVTDSLAILFQTPNYYKTPRDTVEANDGYSFYPWIHYPTESSITVEPGESQEVRIKLTSKYYSNDAVNELPLGVTKSNIFLLSHPFQRDSYEPDDKSHYDAGAFVVPIKINVIENSVPLVDHINNIVITEKESIECTINATDINDSIVTIYLDSIPDFITEVRAENKSITYKIAPTYGDAGEYKLVIHAQDPHGAMDTDTLHLSVLPYHAISDFSLTYFKTGTLILTFNDSITFDVADPNIEKYTIRANTMEENIRSIRFTLDGHLINTDNTVPFTINHWELPKLSAGIHTLRVQAFSKRNARGDGYEMKVAHINVINSASITQFNIVDKNGILIKRVFEGDSINISDPKMNGFNVIAISNINAIRSVKFILNNITARIDNRSPYGVYGTSNGYENPWPITTGSYTLTATPYMKYYAWGPAGTSLTMNFTIVNNASTSINIASAREESLEEMVLNSEEQRQVLVYPNPVLDELYIDLSKISEGNFSLKLVNTHGQLLYSLQGNTEVISEYIISTNQLGLMSGVYYFQLIDAKGFHQVKKIIKQ